MKVQCLIVDFIFSLKSFSLINKKRVIFLAKIGRLSLAGYHFFNKIFFFDKLRSSTVETIKLKK